MKQSKKQKQFRNQKRQAKRGQEKRERKRKTLHLKHTGQPKKKSTLEEVTNMNNVPWKVRIWFFINKIILALKRLGCIIGIHNWKLCSGREGDPMYACIRCWGRSKTKWEKRGSEEYYKEKEDKMGIANPKNWEEKEGKYYFKGEYVKLTEEEVKRLKVVLKIRK